ncbi:dual specificity calcium/calmodulin-dependent 3',5'-cyclic nucleotide phosphodiesterase 1B-like isoform X2 [Halichondria panicea]|uniref:dual specificity calcium/calmodulin-dependent 3',5'-cyclic nucleotide phosphodiesterase 1B-like isoform X2 n=1 Tax=Halichondria panicea TaxID=6063 RepID=UPI00312B9B3B
MGCVPLRGCYSVLDRSSKRSNKVTAAGSIDQASMNGAAASSEQQLSTIGLGRLHSMVVIQVVPAILERGQEAAHPTTTNLAPILQGLLEQLNAGLTPDLCVLKDGLSLALLTLSSDDDKDLDSSDDVLESVSNTQVRAWLATTFTRHEHVFPRPKSPLTPRDRFKAVANTIIIGKYFEHIVKDPALFTGPTYPAGVSSILKESLDSWEFPIFRLEGVSQGCVLRYVGFELFKRHDLFDLCNISPLMFDNFLTRIQADYGSHGNPYHNATHGADVAQTMHHFIQHSSLKAHLTHLDTLSLLLSALIHDVHHPGTSNAFQITQMSEYALMYNDRSVLENHHLHHTFTLLREKQFNILSGLTPEEYKSVRGMVIDMVLATDMSTHFDQLKNTRVTLAAPNSGSQLLGSDRSKTFSLILHLADISHPGKKWAEHLEWSDRLCQEFFCQGDRERSLGLPLSPLCDRDHTNLPDSQIGFIGYIVAPSFDVCAAVFDVISELPLPLDNSVSHGNQSQQREWPWTENMDNNKVMWQKKKENNEEATSCPEMAVQSVSSEDEGVGESLSTAGESPSKPGESPVGSPDQSELVIVEDIEDMS